MSVSVVYHAQVSNLNEYTDIRWALSNWQTTVQFEEKQEGVIRVYCHHRHVFLINGYNIASVTLCSFWFRYRRRLYLAYLQIAPNVRRYLIVRASLRPFRCHPFAPIRS